MKDYIPYTYRPILPDRIRLSVTPSYMDYKEHYPNNTFDEYWASQREQAHSMMQRAKKLGFKITRVDKKPYISPYQYFGYIGNLMISPFQFVPVQMEFNFIRFLNCYLDFSPQDAGYFDNIKIHDNNYLVHSYDRISNAYKKRIGNVVAKAIISSNTAFGLLSPEKISYTQVCIKNIEFNTDIFVGHDQSIAVMQDVIEYLQSRKGINWRQKKVKSICSHIVQNKEKDDRLDVAQYSNSMSTKFELGKGAILKIYTKTKDHIRVEVLFNKKYIQRYGSTNWDNVYEKLYDDACRIIKGIKFHLRIQDIIETKINIDDEVKEMLLVTNACKDILETVQPGLSDILDAKLYTGVVTSPEGIKCIKKYKEFRNEFILDRDNSGNVVYRYSPKEAYEAQERRKEAKRLYNHKNKNSPEMQNLLDDIGSTFR